MLGGELDELGLQPLLLQLDLRHSEHRRLICLDRSLLGGGQGRLELGLAAVRLLARMRERRLGRLTSDLVLGHARLRTIELISQGLELRLKLRRAAGRRRERLRWRRRLRRTRPNARCLQLRRCELPAQLAQLRRHPREHLLLLSVATALRIDETRPRLGRYKRQPVIRAGVPPRARVEAGHLGTGSRRQLGGGGAWRGHGGRGRFHRGRPACDGAGVALAAVVVPRGKAT